MGITLQISTALSAGPLCLLTYPGIFSGLSNEGEQSPALISADTNVPSRKANVPIAESAGFDELIAYRLFLQEPATFTSREPRMNVSIRRIFVPS